MPPTLRTELLSDDALWRVGRNLLCFQQIEAALKSFLEASNESGTISEIKAQRGERRRKMKKESLGKLASSYKKQMLHGEPSGNEPRVGEWS